MVHKEPYIKDQGIDNGLKKMMEYVRQRTSEMYDDDFLIFCTGTTGTGKSSLALHAYEHFDPEGADIDFVGLNKKDHAQALKKAAEKELPRFCCYDEANVSRRDHQNKYNKDLMQLFWQIRGLRMFHWWNNPSADILDKPFIEEKINGLIYIFTKDVSRPRLYYYFTKQKLLEIWAKEKKLTHRILKKNKDLASFRGWFKQYKGRLWESYVKKKEGKMADAVTGFFEKYGLDDTDDVEGWITMSQAAKSTGYKSATFRENCKKAYSEGVLNDQEFNKRADGMNLITREGIDKVVEWKKKTNNKRLPPWTKNKKIKSISNQEDWYEVNKNDMISTKST